MGCYNLPSLDGEDHVHIIVLDIMQGLQMVRIVPHPCLSLQKDPLREIRQVPAVSPYTPSPL